MTWTADTHWWPTQVLDVAASADTSTGATEVTTDAGRAYIKPLGNRQGPHVLATDWVGTHLAKWFGLSTFDIAILVLEDDDVFPLPRNHMAKAGPAFAARALHGEPWSGGSESLDAVVNPQDITRLVVFDTWTLNCDRHYPDATIRKPNRDNVFMSSDGVDSGKRRLVAMDHGLCFIRSSEDLTPSLAEITKVKDESLFGLFPEFRERLRGDTITQCESRLREMDVEIANAMIATIPREWEVSAEARCAWSDLIYRRAAFVADNIAGWIDKACPWFGAGGY